MRNIACLLHAAYQERREQVAVHFVPGQGPDQAVTYGQLIEGSAGYSRALDQAGILPGEVVVQILGHSPDLLYAFFGSMLRGAIPAILPYLTEKLVPEVYRKSLAALVEVTRPAAVITTPEFQPEVRKALRPGDSVRAVLVPAMALPDRRPDVSRWHGLERQAGEVTLLQHSSGTTGLQKGVALSHQAIFNQLESYARAIDLAGNDVVVSWLPLYHDMGLIAGFLMPILTYAPLVLMSPLDWVRAPVRLMQAVSRHKGTLSWLPNFAYNFCAQKIRDRQLEGIDLSSWRAVINCSEPVYHRSHQAFLSRFEAHGLNPRALAASYAMAENVFAVTQGGIRSPLALDRIDRRAFQEQGVARPVDSQEGSVTTVSSGTPIDNTRVRVLDERRRDLPERHLGEIALQSGCMLTGYYNRPDATEKAFFEGWYLTGDIGYLVGDQLFVTGRKKDIIIVGGKNIYPQDIESLASEVEGVHPGRVAAFGIFSEEMGSEEVHLVVESDLGDPQARERIANRIRQVVTQGSDIALRYVKVVDRGWLVKTSSGKTARGANKERYLQQFLGEQG